jgi:hypothetical protein
MKKINLPALLFAFLCSFTACQPELIAPDGVALTQTRRLTDDKAAACTDYYYYDGKERVELGNVLTDRILIGFQDGTSAGQRNQILGQYAFIDTIESRYPGGSADVTVVLLQPNLDCAAVERGLAALVQHPGIRYANPVFNDFQGLWDNGITNQLLLTLRPEYSRADLQQVAHRYEVEVVDELGDNTYVLSVDKRSRATTLQAANLIARSDKVLSCTPDFLFLPAAGI